MGRTAKTQKKVKVSPKTKSKTKPQANNSKKTKKIFKSFNDKLFLKSLNFSMNLSADKHNQFGSLYYASSDLGSLAWEGQSKPRQQNFWVTFQQRYKPEDLPKIALSICCFNTGVDSNSRIFCWVNQVNEEAFQFIVQTLDDSVIYNLGISWFSSGNR